MKKKITVIICLLISAACLSRAQPINRVKPVKQEPISLGITEVIRSAELGEDRRLNIYLPEGYNENDTARYPVIYLLDGGIDEDFIHIAGLVQFNTFPWINNLPKSIVVGIVNVDRQRDFTFPTTVAGDKKKWPTTGGSQKFIAFLERELQPHIKGHYNTNGSGMLIGESLGGLLATEIFFNKPYLFNKYVIVSPSLWWDNGSLLKTNLKVKSTIPVERTDIYIGVGKEGLGLSAEPHVMEVDANVLADMIRGMENKNVRVIFDYLPDETHATIGHQAVFNAFKKLYHPER